VAVAVVALAYAGVRTSWQLARPPARMSPVDGDLVGLSGWAAVGVCLLAAATAGALFPGMGVVLYPVGAASRVVCIGTGMLLVAAAWGC
jgi:hypothetical protein